MITSQEAELIVLTKQSLDDLISSITQACFPISLLSQLLHAQKGEVYLQLVVRQSRKLTADEQPPIECSTASAIVIRHWHGVTQGNLLLSNKSSTATSRQTK